MDNQVDSSTTFDVVETVSESTNIFIEFWNNIDWYGILSSAISIGLQIFFLLIFFYVVKRVGNLFITRTFNSYRKKKSLSVNRINTLQSLTQNLFHSLIAFFLIYTILSLIGIPVGTLLAGAGVIGLALSLGAQGFVSDIVNGFFILLEKQIDVGDTIAVEEIMGTVADINLRTTKVKSFDGTLNYIPNRYITIVSNHSREDKRAQIDIRIDPNEDLSKVNEIIEQVNERLVPEHPEITSGPNNYGLMDIGNGKFIIRIELFSINGSEFGLKNLFFQEYVAALTKEGIDIPVNILDVPS